MDVWTDYTNEKKLKGTLMAMFAYLIIFFFWYIETHFGDLFQALKAKR